MSDDTHSEDNTGGGDRRTDPVPARKPDQSHQANNPLHGVSLKKILHHLVDHYGWEEMGYRIDIRCFTNDPSINSSLTFLRRNPWAREKVEWIYVNLMTGGDAEWVRPDSGDL